MEAFFCFTWCIHLSLPVDIIRTRTSKKMSLDNKMAEVCSLFNCRFRECGGSRLAFLHIRTLSTAVLG